MVKKSLEIRLNEQVIVAIQKEKFLKYGLERHEDEHQNTYLAAQVDNEFRC